MKNEKAGPEKQTAWRAALPQSTSYNSPQAKLFGCRNSPEAVRATQTGLFYN